MADTQLSLNDGVKDGLLQTSEDFRQLVTEHQALDERIQRLSRLAYLTDQQHYEEISLKKRKLALKDKIEAMVRRRQRERTASPSSA